MFLRVMRFNSWILAVALLFASASMYYIVKVSTFERLVIFRIIEIPALIISIFVSLNTSNKVGQAVGMFIGLLVVYLCLGFLIVRIVKVVR